MKRIIGKLVFGILVFFGMQCNLKETESLIACFTPDRTTCYAGDCLVRFTAECSEGASEFIWDFENDGIIDLRGFDKYAVEFSYNTPGTKIARLMVKNAKGSVDETTQSIFVNNSLPPNANFVYAPSSIIADVTMVSFSNQSTGTITGYSWDFGNREMTSTQSNPSYRFDYAGQKTVKLHAYGPLGTHSQTQVITLHAMDPFCHQYGAGSTQSESAILQIRNNGLLRIGSLKVQNNYAGPVIIEIFHPDDWLNGIYTRFSNSWTIPSSTTVTLTLNGNSFGVGNDWGIKLSFTNGVTSCIRTVGDLAPLNNNAYTVLASKIFEGQ